MHARAETWAEGRSAAAFTPPVPVAAPAVVPVVAVVVRAVERTWWHGRAHCGGHRSGRRHRAFVPVSVSVPVPATEGVASQACASEAGEGKVPRGVHRVHLVVSSNGASLLLG
jgi:hypothetical protein